MSNVTEYEGLVDKAKLISAVREYQMEKTRRKEKRIDFTVLPPKSDDRILMRIITEPKAKSGYVSVDTVREMSQTLGKRHYDRGILISKRFTEAARREMKDEDIEVISEGIPLFKPEQLYLVINNFISELCKAKCGHIPKKESDCRGYSDGNYSCNIRLISDDASFHFEHGWTSLLERDFAKLLTLEENLNG
jgi:hypothetical protein